MSASSATSKLSFNVPPGSLVSASSPGQRTRFTAASPFAPETFSSLTGLSHSFLTTTLPSRRSTPSSGLRGSLKP